MVAADIGRKYFWCPGSCTGHRLAAQTPYDGLRAVGDFLENCHKLRPAMVGDQLQLISDNVCLYGHIWSMSTRPWGGRTRAPLREVHA